VKGREIIIERKIFGRIGPGGQIGQGRKRRSVKVRRCEKKCEKRGVKV
jgi:hypothetical protein